MTSAHEWLRRREALSVEDAFHQAKRLDPWAGEESTSVHHVLRGIDEFGHAIEAAWRYGAPPFPGAPPTLSLDPANRRDLASPWSQAAHASFEDLISLVERYCTVLSFGFVPDSWERPDGTIDVVGDVLAVDGHAVLAVGSIVRNNRKLIIVKNSWGEAWGDHGYGYVTQAYAERHLLSAHILELAA